MAGAIKKYQQSKRVAKKRQTGIVMAKAWQQQRSMA